MFLSSGWYQYHDNVITSRVFPSSECHSYVDKRPTELNSSLRKSNVTSSSPSLLQCNHHHRLNYDRHHHQCCTQSWSEKCQSPTPISTCFEIWHLCFHKMQDFYGVWPQQKEMHCTDNRFITTVQQTAVLTIGHYPRAIYWRILFLNHSIILTWSLIVWSSSSSFLWRSLTSCKSSSSWQSSLSAVEDGRKRAHGPCWGGAGQSYDIDLIFFTSSAFVELFPFG